MPWLEILCLGWAWVSEPACPTTYLNLGKTEFLAGRRAQAIQAFRNGLRLAPDHGGLQEHLAFARSQVAYPPAVPGPPFPQFHPPGLPGWSENCWLLGTWLAWLFLCGSGTRWWGTRHKPWAQATLFAALLTAAFASAWWLTSLHYRAIRAENFVVIADKDTPFFLGNGNSYPPHPQLPVLSQGIEGRLLTHRGGWVQVEFPGPFLGWVERNHLLHGEPGPP